MYFASNVISNKKLFIYVSSRLKLLVKDQEIAFIPRN